MDEFLFWFIWTNLNFVLNLDFASGTILSCFFLFSLIIGFYFLIPAAIA